CSLPWWPLASLGRKLPSPRGQVQRRPRRTKRFIATTWLLVTATATCFSAARQEFAKQYSSATISKLTSTLPDRNIARRRCVGLRAIPKCCVLHCLLSVVVAAGCVAQSSSSTPTTPEQAAAGQKTIDCGVFAARDPK